MADALKKGIGTKYLLPIITFYSTSAGLIGFNSLAAWQKNLQHAGVAGITGILLLVFQEIIPRSWKEVAVFWRLRDRVPGCRAFTVIALRDQRVDPTDLAVMLPSGQMSAGEQNALWYRWLKSVEADPGIADNHRRFLILRESTVLMFLLTFVTPLLQWALRSSSASLLQFSVAVFLIYVLFAIAARNASNRLVANVIALKLTKL